MKHAPGLIVEGSHAAVRLSHRLNISCSKAAFWQPMTLHWRKTPRLRAPDRGSARAGDWISVFSPQFTLHFTSDFRAFAKSNSLVTISSIVKPLLMRTGAIVHHRGTLRTHFSREQLFSRVHTRDSGFARVNTSCVARHHRCANLSGRLETPPLPSAPRRFLTSAYSATLTMCVSNNFINRAHYSASSFATAVSLAAYEHERTPLLSFHSSESSRVIVRTELVWRQPQVVAQPEWQDARRLAAEMSQRSRGALLDSRNQNMMPAKITQPLTASAFDAVQMDRFVDNIIGRVEKRQRIERERRGW